jgi:hypothetical protein
MAKKDTVKKRDGQDCKKAERRKGEDRRKIALLEGNDRRVCDRRKAEKDQNSGEHRKKSD